MYHEQGQTDRQTDRWTDRDRDSKTKNQTPDSKLLHSTMCAITMDNFMYNQIS